MRTDMATSYNKNNIFYKFIMGEIPVETIYEDEYVIGLYDIHPAAKIHALVISKALHTSFDDFMAQAPIHTVAGVFGAVRKIAEQLGLQESGYRIIMNHGADALQTIPHFHIHVIGGENLGPITTFDKHHK